VRRRASTACSRFRLRVEYVMVSTLYATGPSGRFPDSSRRYGGSCIAINPSHRDRRRVRTLRCSLLRVKRCYLLTVDREPSRAALSAHGSSPRASIRATMTSRHVTSEIAPCRGAARPAAAHPRAVRCRARARLPPLGWCRSVDVSDHRNAKNGRFGALFYVHVHVHVHSPSRQDAQPPAPWRHNVEGAGCFMFILRPPHN
jgi:hypothetical protein